MASCLGLSKPAAFDVFCLHLSVTNTQHELEDSPVTFAKLARVSAIVITLEKVNIFISILPVLVQMFLFFFSLQHAWIIQQHVIIMSIIYPI